MRRAAIKRDVLAVLSISSLAIAGIVGIGTYARQRSFVPISQAELNLPAKQNPLTHSEIKSLLSNYESWVQVNQRAFPMPPAVAVNCLKQRALGIGSTPDPNFSPHEHKFLYVYVNGIGRDTMFGARNRRFPVGSIIVKQKLPTRESKTPELLTVMVKRNNGFNTISGDWEYFVLDGNAKRVQASGKLPNCQSCHQSQRASDYLFRNYVGY